MEFLNLKLSKQLITPPFSLDSSTLSTSLQLVLPVLFFFFLLFAIYSTRVYESLESAFIESNLSLLSKLAAAANTSTPSTPLTALVSGANSGIGLALSEQLASRGVRVILACRNRQRGEEALLRIQTITNNNKKKSEESPSFNGSNNKSNKNNTSITHRLVLLDVSEPSSVLKATAELLTDPQIGHVDFLVLNAGIMNVAYYKWSVILHSFLTGAFRYFLVTSRASASSSSFLQGSVDELGACGAPSHFATHVLGHLLLVQELQPLLAPLTSSSSSTTSREGRIIWTGSRSSVIPSHPLAISQLEPPSHLGAPSGFQKLLSEKRSLENIELYGQAKYAQDLVNAALSRRISNLCAVICPGFVDTELTPPFFKLAIPFFKLTRRYTPSMVFSGLRGCAPHVAMMVVDKPSLIDANKKWVLSCNKITQATEGAPHLDINEQEKMWERCEQWLKIWRQSVNGKGKEDTVVKQSALVEASKVTSKVTTTTTTTRRSSRSGVGGSSSRQRSSSRKGGKTSKSE